MKKVMLGEMEIGYKVSNNQVTLEMKRRDVMQVVEIGKNFRLKAIWDDIACSEEVIEKMNSQQLSMVVQNFAVCCLCNELDRLKSEIGEELDPEEVLWITLQW